MMIGTCERVRISRHTSTPRSAAASRRGARGCGRPASNRSIASAPSAAASTRNPSRSSATRKRVAVRLLVVDDEDQRRIGHQANSRFVDPVDDVDTGASGTPSGTSSPALRSTRRSPRRRAPARRGGRWRDRDRCRPCRDCGPGRPGRSARRSARGRRAGSRCRGRAPRTPRRRRRGTTDISTVLPRSEYFTALSSRLVSALTTCRRSHAQRGVAARVVDAQPDPRRRGRRLDPLDRLVDEHRHRDLVPRRRLLHLDEAQVEQVVDDPPQPLGLVHELLGEAAGDLGVATRQPASRPAAPARRSASSARGSRWRRSRGARSRRGGAPRRPARTTAAPTSASPSNSGNGTQSQHHAAAGRTAASSAVDRRAPVHASSSSCRDLGCRDRVGVAGVAVPLGRRVAEHLVAVGVDDDDPVARPRSSAAASRSRCSSSVAASSAASASACSSVGDRRRRSRAVTAQPNRPVM